MIELRNTYLQNEQQEHEDCFTSSALSLLLKQPSLKSAPNNKGIDIQVVVEGKPEAQQDNLTNLPHWAAAGQREDLANFFPRGMNRQGEAVLGRKDPKGGGTWRRRCRNKGLQQSSTLALERKTYPHPMVHNKRPVCDSFVLRIKHVSSQMDAFR
jgi:hypothetical protein